MVMDFFSFFCFAVLNIYSHKFSSKEGEAYRLENCAIDCSYSWGANKKITSCNDDAVALQLLGRAKAYVKPIRSTNCFESPMTEHNDLVTVILHNGELIE